VNWYQVVTLILTANNLVWSAVFCIDYHRLSGGAWRRTEYGMMLMLLAGSLGALMAFVFASRLFGDSLVRQIFGVVLYGALSLCLPWMHRLMRLSQRHASKVDVRTEGGASDGT
jgi:uncharacterized membrane protein YsdA (DUF1294 family)